MLKKKFQLKFSYCILLFVAVIFYTTSTGQTAEQDLHIKITPFKKNCVYNEGQEAGYWVTLTNLHTEPQTGTFKIEVQNTTSGTGYVSVNIDLNLRKKGSYSKPFSLGRNKLPPGFYKVYFIINTNFYEDTLTSVFGVSPNKITYETHKPKDFDEFWDNTLKTLAAIDPKYEVTLDNGLTTRYHSVYQVQMTSWNNVRLTGFLTIPRLKGKYPVTVNFAGYLGLVSPVFYEDYAALSVNIRGVGPNAKQALPANAEFNTYNMDNKDKYIYRGVYMDCVRAVDFVLSHGDLGLDTKRIVVYGGSQGGTEALITAALTKKVNGAAANNPIFADYRSIFISGRKEKELVFPMVQFERYFKYTRITDAQAFKTLDYYDLINFMDKIECPVLIGLGLKDPISPPPTIIAAFNYLRPAIKAKSKIFFYPNLTHEVADLHWTRNFNWIDDKFLTPHF